ncbi:unnamed protein product [Burkholderia pseudomallei]|nr:unnamed protein product [Burkholderia pseudomallei]
MRASCARVARFAKIAGRIRQDSRLFPICANPKRYRSYDRPRHARRRRHAPLAEWIGLGTLALLYLFGLGWAVRGAASRARGRAYWIACAALIVGGTACALVAPPSPPDSGEMPPGFGLGVLVTLLGIAGTTAGCAWRAIARLRRGRP